MNFTLFDDANCLNLLPFTHTRPVADIRCGILTMRKRWELVLNNETGSLTRDYLQKVYLNSFAADSCFINGAVFANIDLVKAIRGLKSGEKLISGNVLIAAIPEGGSLSFIEFHSQIAGLKSVLYSEKIRVLSNIWDIFSLNGDAINDDFKILTYNRKSAAIPEYVMVAGAGNLFIEEGAEVGMGCMINATTGPVYIGKNAHVLEGVMMHGPVAIDEDAVVKMGAKIYGATTIGYGCKVGGEISNVVFFANSNKSHDGYLGNAVIGEWCNLGADTNCSNLKNNYDKIKIWSEHEKKMIDTGLIFCGLMMGDHSKCGINTMFNTGTVVGVSANIFGGGFPPKFIPSFSWGGADEITIYTFEKAIETANRMMGRRNRSLSADEIEMYRYIFSNK